MDPIIPGPLYDVACVSAAIGLLAAGAAGMLGLIVMFGPRRPCR